MTNEEKLYWALNNLLELVDEGTPVHILKRTEEKWKEASALGKARAALKLCDNLKLA